LETSKTRNNQPLNQSKIKNKNLEFGKTYLLFREGQFIGEAVWTNDKNIGHSFICQEEQNGQIVNVVYIADEWIEKAENY
jgi:hypothetical protein